MQCATAWSRCKEGRYQVLLSSRTAEFHRSVFGWAQNWAQCRNSSIVHKSATAGNPLTDKQKVGGRDRVRTCDPLLAKQVLSQLSYTPTVRVTFILKHFSRFQNPFPRVLRRWSEPLF
jgi:hypothetical protein